MPIPNSAIIARMMTTPFTATIVGNPDAYGDAASEQTYSGTCYVVEERKLIITDTGEQLMSGMQLYVATPEAMNLPISAKISCLTSVDKRIMRKDTLFAPEGVQGLVVFYLP